MGVFIDSCSGLFLKLSRPRKKKIGTNNSQHYDNSVRIVHQGSPSVKSSDTGS